jgi:outer membrane protein assembly factor BamB
VTGKLLWEFPTGGPVRSSPALANGVVYVGSDDHNLYALSAATGHELWHATSVGPVASPNVVNGVVYVGFGNLARTPGGLEALNAGTGIPIWTVSSGGVGAPISSSPAIANGLVYVYSGSGYFYAFDASSGTIRWHRLLGRGYETSPAVANGDVYVGSTSGLLALNAVTGAVRWVSQTGQVETSAAVANGVVYVGTVRGIVAAVNAFNGAVRWTYMAGGTTTGGVTANPTVANGVLYDSSAPSPSQANLLALNPVTGTKLWEHPVAPTETSCSGSASVANGFVYFGSCAFALPAH